jgi:uncharacterized protein YciI
MIGYVFRLVPPRADVPTTMSQAELETMMAHVAYWTELMDQGKVVAFGPVDDEDPYGIGIITVDDVAEAEALRANDPALLSPHGFRCELTPMARLVTPDGVFDAAPAT